MPIFIIDTLQQYGGASFPLLQDVDLQGGFRVVATTALRDAIPANFRETGMYVHTLDTNKLWRLTSAPGTLPGTWVEFSGGGGSGDAVVDNGLLAGEALTAGWAVAFNSSGQVVRADAAGVGSVLQPYGLAAADALSGAAASVVTHGVCSFSPGGLTPGSVLYLAEGGGYPTPAAPDGSVSGHSVVRIGQARTTNTIHVNVQFVAMT